MYEGDQATARWRDVAAADVCRGGGGGGGGGGQMLWWRRPRDWAGSQAEEESRVRSDSRPYGETLPVSSPVDHFLVENEGKRAANLGLVGFQRAAKIGPGEIGTGKIGLGNSQRFLREFGLPKKAQWTMGSGKETVMWI